jgi:beta-1,4-mannosyltransferase
VIVTGKGPEIDDYPKIVASADLGVCLHYSSSGYDLPMKVVDMFSAGTPCLAYKYLCIDELVEDGRNGRVFANEEELCEQLFDTLKGFKQGTTETLTKYRENLKGFGDESWD